MTGGNNIGKVTVRSMPLWSLLERHKPTPFCTQHVASGFIEDVMLGQV